MAGRRVAQFHAEREPLGPIGRFDQIGSTLSGSSADLTLSIPRARVCVRRRAGHCAVS
jgi:hypothetical protein